MSGLRLGGCFGLMAVVVLAAGCDGPARTDSGVDEVDSGLWDGDGDGYAAADQGGLDCDDANPGVSPVAAEVVYDGLDNDCDPATRDDDLDGDGYPASEDCRDDVVAVSPGAEDLVGDGYDENCDGLDGTDADGDGVPSVESLGADCDDQDADTFPGAAELCDDGVVNDCDAPDAEAALAACGWADEIRLGEAATKLTGAVGGESFGEAVDLRGDLDGDGRADVVVGATTRTSSIEGNGGVYVLGDEPTAGAVDEEAAVWLGESEESEAGGALSTSGDVDGDGLDDLVVGSPYFELGSETGGAVYLVQGPAAGGGSLAEADLRITGGQDGLYLGGALGTGADLTGDGAVDLAVGAIGFNKADGADGVVYIVDGAAGSGIASDVASFGVWGSTSEGYFGGALTVGDLNGDGAADLVVAAPCDDTDASSAGQAYVLYGPFSGSVSASDADAVVSSTSEWAYFGSSLSLGDNDGDGYTDLAVGAPGFNDGPGLVALFRGPIAGPVDGSGAAFRMIGEDDQRLGSSVELGGDFDGDGLADLVSGGSSRAAADGSMSAALVVGYGPLEGGIFDTHPDVDLSLETADSVWHGALSAGDANADGLSDLLVGAARYSDDATSAGAVYLLRGYSY